MKCCSSIINLGCFDVCEDLQSGLITDETGLHVLEIKFLSMTIKKEVSLTSGDEIVLPKMYINESSEIIVNVKKPSGYMANSYSLTTKPCIDVT